MDAGRDEGRALGLLELDVPAPGFPFPSAAADGVGADGRFLSGDVGHYQGQLPGRRREGRSALSARVRYRTGVRAAAFLGILAVVLGGCFWWQASAGSAQVVPLNESSTAASEVSGQESVAASAPPGEVASDGPGSITVHVAGAVATPGVVQLPAGSRVHQAITAAGGATKVGEPDKLNLAAVLEDGQKILVPVRGAVDPEPAQPSGGGAAASATGAGGTSPGGGGGKINLNTAGVEELGTLPRVGPVLAQRIVDWRQQHGRFKAVQELDAVDGIGPKLLAALLPLVSV
jgi:competence protein ComEA